jgi:hypothetical protein
MDDEQRRRAARQFDVAWGLQQKFDNVPIPTKPDGTPYTAAEMRATGTDQHVVIHCPGTDELWEFWKFRDNWPSAYSSSTGFNCGFGGYSNNVSTWSGIFTNNWGARACSLSMIGGVMMMRDYANGVFPYALCCAIPVVKQGFIAPATRGDAVATSGVQGGSFADAVPEGLIVRLPPGYEPPSRTHPLTKMMVTAIRDYGLVVTDATSSTLNFYIEASRAVGTPYQVDGFTTTPWPSSAEMLNARKSLNYDVDWTLLQQVKYP